MKRLAALGWFPEYVSICSLSRSLKRQANHANLAGVVPASRSNFSDKRARRAPSSWDNSFAAGEVSHGVPKCRCTHWDPSLFSWILVCATSSRFSPSICLLPISCVTCQCAWAAMKEHLAKALQLPCQSPQLVWLWSEPMEFKKAIAEAFSNRQQILVISCQQSTFSPRSSWQLHERTTESKIFQPLRHFHSSETRRPSSSMHWLHPHGHQPCAALAGHSLKITVCWPLR